MRLLVVALLSGVGGLCATSPALAQDAQAPQADSGDASKADAGRGEIVVTARRRSESVQNVPMSLNAFGEDNLRALGVNEGRDVGKLVPGLVWKGAGASTRNNVFVRGVGNASVAYSSSPAVAIYLDDTYLNAQSMHGFASFDIDRVEVLKGPQGTLYGRNTTGGAIKFVTKKPKVGAPASGDVDVDIGNFSYIKAEAGISLPLGDIAALRISGVSINRGGMYRDYLSGGRLVDKDVQAVRAQLAIEPTPELSILLSGSYGRSRSDNVRYKRIDYIDASKPAGFDPDTFAPFYSICANPMAGTGPGCTNFPILYGIDNPESNHDAYALQSNVRRGKPPEHNTVYGGSANIDYDLGKMTLSSVTSYFHDSLQDPSDVDGSVENLASIRDTARLHQVSQELRLASNDGSRFKWVLGGFYFRERLNASAPVTISADTPDLGPFGLGAVYTQITQSKAIFAEGTYSVLPKLDLTVGLRYSNDKKNMTFEYYNFMPDGRPFIDYQDLVTDSSLGYTPIFSVPRTTDSSNSLSGRFSLSYKFTPEIMLYASYNRGYKGAEFNVGADHPETATFAKPETVNAYEVGLKSELFDRVVRFNIAGYYYDYKNKQETLFDAGVQRVANAQARVWGFDADLTITPVDGLTLGGTFAYLNSKYRDFPNCTPAGGNCTGNRLPNAPRFSTQLMASYAFDLGDHTVTLSGNGSYRSAIDFSAMNVSYLRQDPYWLFDARASVGVTKNIEASLWIKNIGNKRYFVDAFDVSNLGYSLAMPGEARTFGVGFSGHF
jgi:iron complex outermembrane receptor protein